MHIAPIKARILQNWTFMRVLYLLMGIVIIIQSVIARQWFGMAFGGYFAAMGLFAIGCASGNCYTNTRAVKQNPNEPIQPIEFEEVTLK